jgi:hypothetical protein
MRLKIIFYFLVLNLISYGQEDCASAFVTDTMFVPKEGKVVSGQYIETVFKNQSVVRLFKASDNRYYMRLLVKENFYFDKVDVLEIRSGSKSYYAKETRQFKINKTTGLFVIEIYKNYVTTLKEDGITSIVFANTETDFTRQDASQVKKMARCFFDSMVKK